MSISRRGGPASVQLPRNSLGELARALERELGNTTRQDAEARHPSVLLTAPDGGTWRLSVDNSGVVTTVAVPRT